MSEDYETPAVPQPAVRLHLERMVGLQFQGWVLDPAAPGRETLTLHAGDEWVHARVARTSREDVNAAHGVAPGIDLGFTLQLEPDVWQRVAQHPALTLRVNGQAVNHEPIAQWLGHVHPTRPSHVEGLYALAITGWVADSASAPADLALRLEHAVIGTAAQRKSRMDVAHLLGIQEEQFGFEVDIPGTIWHGRPDDALSLQLLIDGHPVGQRFTLQRAQLIDELGRALSLHDTAARTHRALIALEHVLHAELIGALDVGHRQAIARILLDEGLPDLEATSDAREPSLSLAPERAPASCRPVGRLGRWLQDPKHADLALRTLRRLKAWPVGKGLATALEVALTRAVGLFDAGFYAETAPEAARGALAPLQHYVQAGDARALAPMPLFDARHYSGQLEGRAHPGVNRLLHYALVGRRQGLSPSRWFDAAYYLRSNPDVAALHSADPLRHWLRFGWKEGRKPHPGFAARTGHHQNVHQRLRGASITSHPDPRVAYLLDGNPNCRGQLPWRGEWQLDGIDWLDVNQWPRTEPAPPAHPDAARTAIVLPVYAGAQMTLRCLASALAHTSGTRIIVVDDCSPEPALSACLQGLAAAGRIELLRNPHNLGFVASVNRALAACPDANAVLLNADTRVHAGWLTRLLAHAEASPRAASITPLSNNATIASFPRMPAGGPLPVGCSDAALDALASEVNAGLHVQVPTGVGFCMWMRREAIDEVGALDEAAFGRGYGEENDWCQRAIAAGWHHLIAADVFVLHEGGVSFAAESQARIQAALQTLAQRYPRYEADVAEWIAADPLAGARARLDAATLRASVGERVALSVGHARGGGTERFQREEEARLRQQGLAVLWLRPGTLPGTVSLAPGHAPALPNLGALSVGGAGGGASASLWDVLSLFAVAQVQLHHLADAPPALRQALAAWCAIQGVPLNVLIHDYHMVCPRVNLVDATLRYCGEPSRAGCNACLASARAPGGRVAGAADITRWRDEHLALLAQAQHIQVPSDDTAVRMRRYAPGLRWEVVPHDTPPPAPPDAPPATPIRHVLVLGALSAIKGYEVLRRLAACPTAKAARMQFSLLGYSRNDDALREAGVKVLGRYEDARVLARIAAQKPDLIVIPSVWPETYCYTLSAAMASGVRIAVFDLGAQAERLAAWDPERRWHRRWPLALSDQPDRLVLDILAWEEEAKASRA